MAAVTIHSDFIDQENEVCHRFHCFPINLLTKVHIVKATVFPVVTYEYESWMTKTAEHQKSDAF